MESICLLRLLHEPTFENFCECFRFIRTKRAQTPSFQSLSDEIVIPEFTEYVKILLSHVDLTRVAGPREIACMADEMEDRQIIKKAMKQIADKWQPPKFSYNMGDQLAAYEDLNPDSFCHAMLEARKNKNATLMAFFYAALSDLKRESPIFLSPLDEANILRCHNQILPSTKIRIKALNGLLASVRFSCADNANLFGEANPLMRISNFPLINNATNENLIWLLDAMVVNPAYNMSHDWENQSNPRDKLHPNGCANQELDKFLTQRPEVLEYLKKLVTVHGVMKS